MEDFHEVARPSHVNGKQESLLTNFGAPELQRYGPQYIKSEEHDDFASTLPFLGPGDMAQSNDYPDLPAISTEPIPNLVDDDNRANWDHEHNDNRNEEDLAAILNEYNDNQKVYLETNDRNEEDARDKVRSDHESRYDIDSYVESSLFYPDRSSSPELTITGYGNNQEGDLPIPDASKPRERDPSVVSDAETPRKRAKTSNNQSIEHQVAEHGSKIAKAGANKGKSKSKSRRSRKPKAQVVKEVDLHGLFNNDIIAQATRNQSLPSQPLLQAGDRQSALRALINSLPVEERDLYRGDRAELDRAAKVFTGQGRKLSAIRAAGEAGWLLKGMKSHLQHHQLIGAAFMRRREAEGLPNGGILGDVMGFGKTVICLANLVDGMPLRDYQGPRATLIIVPSALMAQWRNEIERHVENATFPKIVVYGAGSRWIQNFEDPIGHLARQDIVITSYHEVMSSMPLNEPPSHLTTERAKLEWWDQHFEACKGFLHQVNWYRIVLDESQIIKNHLSRTSLAARALNGKFRWVLSGTPVLNNLKEWYATLDFLRLSHIGSYDLFCKNFCRKGSGKALQRLQFTINKIMLRRTHDSKMFGRPIVKLPPIKDSVDVKISFNNVERAIYTIVLDRFCKKINPIASGQKNYKSIFVLLLRLRQLVGHPLLIQKTLKELLEIEDLEKLWTLTDPSATSTGAAATDGSRETAKALEAALSHMSAETEPSIQEKLSDNELSASFRKYLQDLHDKGEWAKANQRSLCNACGSPPEEPLITLCKHLYCKGCLNTMKYAASLNDTLIMSCLECGSRIDDTVPFVATAYQEASARKNSLSTASAEETADWYDLPGPMLRSTKINACVEQIRKWFQEDATNKVIVFVQFRGLIQILSRILDEERWGHTKFDGTMSFDSRDKAIHDFSNNAETRILIAALKAGGVGLNLTAANKIVILDCWWHVLQEQQAWCRAYRIGQTREVEVVRFVIQKSIDEKILEMQARKTKEIDSVLKPGMLPKLSEATVRDLFGQLQKQNSGDSESQVPNSTQAQTQNHSQSRISDAMVRGDEDDDCFILPDDPYDNRINAGDEDIQIEDDGIEVKEVI